MKRISALALAMGLMVGCEKAADVPAPATNTTTVPDPADMMKKMQGEMDATKKAAEKTVEDGKAAVEGAAADGKAKVEEGKEAVQGAAEDAKAKVDGAAEGVKDAVDGAVKP